MNKQPLSSHNLALVPFLAALCFFLSAVEYAIPKPFPFMRLGLANLPIILALFLLPARSYFFLVLVKVFGQAVVSGTLFSYVVLFSAGGTFASSIAMFVLYRLFLKHVTGLGLSLFGSLANNTVQLFLARFILFGKGAYVIAPLLFISGTITGLALGFFAEQFISRSRWFFLCKEQSFPSAEELVENEESSLFVDNIQTKKRKLKFLPPLIIFVSIVFFSLLQPFGKVLFSVFSFDITWGALVSGIKRASILTIMVFVSRLFVSRSFKIPGKAGEFMNTVFYYLGLLTQKKINKGSFMSILKAVDTRLVHVYFSTKTK